MKFITKIIVLAAVAVLLVGFSAHKFYVGIYQVNYVAEKKMLQITTRIFLDDFNEALQIKYNQPMRIGESDESEQDIALMQKYIREKMLLRANGKNLEMEYMSKEIEDNVLICYFRVKGISKVKHFEVQNKILLDYVTEQQNIIQTNINGKRQSLLLSSSKVSAAVQY